MSGQDGNSSSHLSNLHISEHLKCRKSRFEKVPFITNDFAAYVHDCYPTEIVFTFSFTGVAFINENKMADVRKFHEAQGYAFLGVSLDCFCFLNFCHS